MTTAPPITVAGNDAFTLEASDLSSYGRGERSQFHVPLKATVRIAPTRVSMIRGERCESGRVQRQKAKNLL